MYMLLLLLVHNSYSTTPLRAQRRAELAAVLETGTKRLFEQQIKMLTSGALRSYKRDLLALLNTDKLNEEEEATLLRKVSAVLLLAVHCFHYDDVLHCSRAAVCRCNAGTSSAAASTVTSASGVAGCVQCCC
jgi:hypothetical protein